MNRYGMVAMVMIWSICGAAWADPGGCVDSPENPTAVLGALGLAAAGIPWLRTKLRLWRQKP